jgi:hypothetical protein
MTRSNDRPARFPVRSILILFRMLNHKMEAEWAALTGPRSGLLPDSPLLAHKAAVALAHTPIVVLPWGALLAALTAYTLRIAPDPQGVLTNLLAWTLLILALTLLATGFALGVALGALVRARVALREGVSRADFPSGLQQLNAALPAGLAVAAVVAITILLAWLPPLAALIPLVSWYVVPLAAIEGRGPLDAFEESARRTLSHQGALAPWLSAFVLSIGTLPFLGTLAFTTYTWMACDSTDLVLPERFLSEMGGRRVARPDRPVAASESGPTARHAATSATPPSESGSTQRRVAGGAPAPWESGPNARRGTTSSSARPSADGAASGAPVGTPTRPTSDSIPWRTPGSGGAEILAFNPLSRPEPRTIDAGPETALSPEEILDTTLRHLPEAAPAAPERRTPGTAWPTPVEPPGGEENTLLHLPARG